MLQIFVDSKRFIARKNPVCLSRALAYPNCRKIFWNIALTIIVSAKADDVPIGLYCTSVF